MAKYKVVKNKQHKPVKNKLRKAGAFAGGAALAGPAFATYALDTAYAGKHSKKSAAFGVGAVVAGAGLGYGVGRAAQSVTPHAQKHINTAKNFYRKYDRP